MLDTNSDFQRSDLDILISESSHTSLNIVAETIETLGLGTFERAYLAEFLRGCSHLYLIDHEQYDRAIGDRYFLKKFINGLDRVTIEWLLDDLTKDLACICGKSLMNVTVAEGLARS